MIRVCTVMALAIILSSCFKQSASPDEYIEKGRNQGALDERHKWVKWTIDQQDSSINIMRKGLDEMLGSGECWERNKIYHSIVENLSNLFLSKNLPEHIKPKP